MSVSIVAIFSICAIAVVEKLVNHNYKGHAKWNTNEVHIEPGHVRLEDTEKEQKK